MESRFTTGSASGTNTSSDRNEEINNIRQKMDESQKRQRELANAEVGPQKTLYDMLQENRG